MIEEGWGIEVHGKGLIVVVVMEDSRSKVMGGD